MLFIKSIKITNSHSSFRHNNTSNNNNKVSDNSLTIFEPLTT